MSMWRIAWLLGVLCASAIGVGYVYSVAQESPLAYATEPVGRGAISNVIRATGSVEAVLSVDVSSQLSGRVAEVYVSFNDSVTAGEPVPRLDRERLWARATE